MRTFLLLSALLLAVPDTRAATPEKALAAYRAKNRNYPEKLEALSPDILKQIPLVERESVIVGLMPSPAGFEPRTLIGNFDLTLASVR